MLTHFEPGVILAFDLILIHDRTLASLNLELDMHPREAFVMFFIRQMGEPDSFWGTYASALLPSQLVAIRLQQQHTHCSH